MSDVKWVSVAAVGDCPPGTLTGVEAEGHKVVIANVDGDLYALQDRCSHADFPLSTGALEGNRIRCDYHGAKFDACTGKNLQLPAVRPVPTYPVEVRDGAVFVGIPG